MKRFLKAGLVVGGVALALGSLVSAQGGTPLTFDKATVSPETAKRTLVKAQVSAAVARQLVDACLEFARNQQGGPGTYAIFVLAPNGDIIDAHVMDGVLPIGAETGLMKAQTALYARTPSSEVAQRFPNLEGRAIRMDLGRAQGLSYYFVGGGLPIVVENQLIGAMGAGGNAPAEGGGGRGGRGGRGGQQ